jgi:hypothetical protein
MISLKYNFLFIHVPKTGGNSIQTILANYSEDTLTNNKEHQDGIERFALSSSTYKLKKHSKLNRYRKVLPTKLYQQLFKFATIRNPWDKMISLYFSPHRGTDSWDRKDFIQLVGQAPALQDFVTLPSFRDRLEKKFGLPSRPRPLDKDIDHLIRFENLNDDFKDVCRKIGLPAAPELPLRNQGNRKHYSIYYDDELIDLVARKFTNEIEFGDYSFSKDR